MKSLKLFGVVPAAAEPYTNDDYALEEAYGIVIAPSAMPYAEDIRAFLRSSELTSSQLNTTSFSTSWKKVESVDVRERLMDQITHYFSTYGLQALGIASPEYIYLPLDAYQEAAPQKLVLRVVRGVPIEELTQACLDILSSGIALKQETIEDVLEVLIQQCKYPLHETGVDFIQNREALVLVASRAGVLPTNPDNLFRFFVYQATGKTLVIKNDEAIQQIQGSGFCIPPLTADQEDALAEHFNRRKPLWLAFKKANPANRTVVNRIARKSKSRHAPLPVNVLSHLTSTVFPTVAVQTALSRANTFQIARVLNALRFYLADGDARFYHIRNGKSYARLKEPAVPQETLRAYHDLLLAALRERVAGQAVHMPDYLQYALPVSEKMFTGNVPNNSRVFLPYDEARYILIGVYWENGAAAHVDLDLSALALNEKIGWNALWNNTTGVMYSGDVTDAPDGASEWLYCQQVDEPYLVILNAFCAPEQQKFTLILGYGTNVTRNAMIDPNNVVFSVETEMTQKQSILGLLQPDEAGITFSIINQFAGNRIVSSSTEPMRIARQAIVTQTTSALMLQDVVPLAEAGKDLTTSSLREIVHVLA